MFVSLFNIGVYKIFYTGSALQVSVWFIRNNKYTNNIQYSNNLLFFLLQYKLKLQHCKGFFQMISENNIFPINS